MGSEGSVDGIGGIGRPMNGIGGIGRPIPPIPFSLARAISELDRTKDFPKGTYDLKGSELNVLIRQKISFVGVAHLTRGDRSCSWALYRLYKPHNCRYRKGWYSKIYV